jgi:hypothetical protein
MRWKGLLAGAAVLAALGYAYWKLAIPVHRVTVRSELIMLGDLDGDRRWSAADVKLADEFLADPFAYPDSFASRLDLNQNGLLDDDDFRLLRALAAAGDPYVAEAAARARGEPLPRPRELYRYVSLAEYRPRPTWALPHAWGEELAWLQGFRPSQRADTYEAALETALYAEAARLDFAYRKRASGLTPLEREYASRKLARARALFESGDRYELLLAFMELVEDAETLTARDQPEYALQLLRFRDHLREVLDSPLYADFKAGKQSWRDVLKVISGHLEADLGVHRDIETLGPPRDLTHLENYLKRIEWQYYKSTARAEDLVQLVQYAQHDPRYLRAVSRTSRKLEDPRVQNHNLPMVLLFREALRIEGGDKKKAVGLLDEAIRIPYGWIKSIPPELLPSSLALDNFLLPGNKEDGADKSRHWNVFGGICLYKSPAEALELALKRERNDLRDANYSVDGMNEFIRDMIANLNGMYHVMTVDPELLGHGGVRPDHASSPSTPSTPVSASSAAR